MGNLALLVLTITNLLIAWSVWNVAIFTAQTGATCIFGSVQTAKQGQLELVSK